MRRRRPVPPSQVVEQGLGAWVAERSGEAIKGLSATEALDALALAAFSGPAGRERAAPLFAQFDREVADLSPEDPDFELLQLVRVDWAVCDATIPGGVAGDTWGWRAAHGELAGVTPVPSWQSAARSIAGLFEVFPGEPTWVRDRITGVVVRLLDSIGPWPNPPTDRAAALWELRLVPDAGGFRIARPPIEYPEELLEWLDRELAGQFAVPKWPGLQDLRRARLRTRRVEGRTPITRMLRFRT